MKVWIEEDTLTGIADAIRSKKGTSGLIPTPNMKDEILSISGGGSFIENSFTVNFYDVDKNLIESHTAKVGNQIGSPLSFNAVRWEASDGADQVFPMTSDVVGAVIDIYSFADSYSDMLYSHFKMDKAEWPYVMIELMDGGGTHSVRVTFIKSITSGIGTNSLVFSEVNMSYGVSIGQYLTAGDAKSAVDAAMEFCTLKITYTNHTFTIYTDAFRYHYANFDCEYADAKWYLI